MLVQHETEKLGIQTDKTNIPESNERRRTFRRIDKGIN